MSSQDLLLTDMRHAPGWYAMLPRPAPAKGLKGQQVADWVVVGAGVTGLAATRRLAELALPLECRSAPSEHETYGAPAVQSPNRPNKLRRSPCNVSIKTRVALDSRLCYIFAQ